MATTTHMQQSIIKAGGTKSVITAITPVGSAPSASPKAATRACPTRATGPVPLFQHQVTVSQCQSKQRGLYHKCFTCSHGNGR